MSRFIQLLETRCLWSASAMTLSADLSAVRSDATAVRVALAAGHEAFAADLRSLSKDVIALRTRSNNKLLAQLDVQVATGGAREMNLQRAMLANSEALSAIITAQGRLLLLKPTAGLRAQRLTANIAKLNANLSNEIGALETAGENWVGAVEASLNGIASANPSSAAVDADGTQAASDFEAEGQTYGAAVVTLEGAVTTLGVDASSLG